MAGIVAGDRRGSGGLMGGKRKKTVSKSATAKLNVQKGVAASGGKARPGGLARPGTINPSAFSYPARPKSAGRPIAPGMPAKGNRPKQGTEAYRKMVKAKNKKAGGRSF
jgi:hypothetical protein